MAQARVGGGPSGKPRDLKIAELCGQPRCFTERRSDSSENSARNSTLPFFGRAVGTKAVDRAIEYSKSQPHVWLATRSDIAQWWLKQNYS